MVLKVLKMGVMQPTRVNSLLLGFALLLVTAVLARGAAVTVVQFWALAKVQRSMAVAMRMHFFIWVTPACRRFTREGIRYGAQKKEH